MHTRPYEASATPAYRSHSATIVFIPWTPWFSLGLAPAQPGRLVSRQRAHTRTRLGPERLVPTPDGRLPHPAKSCAEQGEALGVVASVSPRLAPSMCTPPVQRDPGLHAQRLGALWVLDAGSEMQHCLLS